MGLVLSTEFEAGLKAKATAKGLSVEDYLKQLLERENQFKDDYFKFPPDEWVRRWRAWCERHRGMNLPTLPDEAISRELIYAERGL